MHIISTGTVLGSETIIMNGEVQAMNVIIKTNNLSGYSRKRQYTKIIIVKYTVATG